MGNANGIPFYTTYCSSYEWVDPGEVSIPSNPIPRGEGNGGKGFGFPDNPDKIPLEILDEILSPEIPIISPVYIFDNKKFWTIITVSLLVAAIINILLFLGWFNVWKLILAILTGLILLRTKKLWIKKIIILFKKR